MYGISTYLHLPKYSIHSAHMGILPSRKWLIRIPTPSQETPPPSKIHEYHPPKRDHFKWKCSSSNYWFSVCKLLVFLWFACFVVGKRLKQYSANGGFSWWFTMVEKHHQTGLLYVFGGVINIPPNGIFPEKSSTQKVSLRGDMWPLEGIHAFDCLVRLIV